MVDLQRHLLNVSRLSALMGEELKLNNNDIKDLSISGMFHDIGKIKINKSVLNKRGRLTNIEMEIMKHHSIFSAEIAKEKGCNDRIIKAILCHHERFDGAGYNEGLKGKEIPLFARIIAITDAYDAMTHNRPYSVAISNDKALLEINKCSGKQFDPELVKIFEIVMDKEINYSIEQYV